MARYLPRLVDNLIRELLNELPAVLVVGPRAAGKTTTAARHAVTLVRLDRPAEAAAFRADPDAALASFDEPVALDEWQEVPTVLGAVKRAVDEDPRPGRFLLTGSVLLRVYPVGDANSAEVERSSMTCWTRPTISEETAGWSGRNGSSPRRSSSTRSPSLSTCEYERSSIRSRWTSARSIA
jgi:hypothetical protein